MCSLFIVLRNYLPCPRKPSSLRPTSSPKITTNAKTLTPKQPPPRNIDQPKRFITTHKKPPLGQHLDFGLPPPFFNKTNHNENFQICLPFPCPPLLDHQLRRRCVCDQAAWVGTYTGSIDCTPGGAQDVTVTVTASGTSALNVSYVTADSTSITFTDPITYTDCNFDVTAGNQGDTLSVNATRSGDMLTLNSSLTVSDSTTSVTTTCVINATKN